MIVLGSSIVRRLAPHSAAIGRSVVGAWSSSSAALDHDRSYYSSSRSVEDDDSPSTTGIRRRRRISLGNCRCCSTRTTATSSWLRRLIHAMASLAYHMTANPTTDASSRSSGTGDRHTRHWRTRPILSYVPRKRGRTVSSSSRSCSSAARSSSFSAPAAAKIRARWNSTAASMVPCDPASQISSALDYAADEAVRLLSFDEDYEGFVCGPGEMTRRGDDHHYCRIHTLEEVFATLRDHPDVPSDFIVYVELKGPDTAMPVVELVDRMDVGRMCRYSSFDHSRISEVRMLNERAVTGALFSGRVPDDFVDAAIEAGANEVHLRYDTCTYDKVREALRAGLSTMAWFRGPSKYVDVGNEAESTYQTVLRTGVDRVCVNRPDVMLKVLKGIQRAH
ncbi:hypothetical protein ACHAXA_008484 [Cyclostephanos tholiformis]|uniref:GP-PDE domain-containing protein n=1 Tax=Cyclostephanos tholiformis TaxID=382380 RepID=A0ABD3SBG9_9STRA